MKKSAKGLVGCVWVYVYAILPLGISRFWKKPNITNPKNAFNFTLPLV